jgi:Skp family chaperone for outer membrane proteins
MKQNVRLVKAAAIVAVMIAFSGVGYAQCKIAVVNMQEAVTESNEGKAKAAQFDARVEEWKGKIDKLQGEIDQANAKLKQSAIASQAVTNDLNKTIRDKTSELTRTQEDAQKDVEDYRDTLLSPVMKVADEVMQALAAEKGYGIVIDSSAQNSSIVYASKDCDATTELKTRMNAKSGVAAPATGAKGATPTPAAPRGGGASPAPASSSRPPTTPATSPAAPASGTRGAPAPTPPATNK